MGSRVCHCVLASWVCISILSQQSEGQRRGGSCSCLPVRWGLGLFQVEEIIIRQKPEAWMVANEAPFPLPGKGLKEETSLRLEQEL